MRYRIVQERGDWGRFLIQRKGFLGWKTISSQMNLLSAEDYLTTLDNLFKDTTYPQVVMERRIPNE